MLRDSSIPPHGWGKVTTLFWHNWQGTAVHFHKSGEKYKKKEPLVKGALLYDDSLESGVTTFLGVIDKGASPYNACRTGHSVTKQLSLSLKERPLDFLAVLIFGGIGHPHLTPNIQKNIINSYYNKFLLWFGTWARTCWVVIDSFGIVTASGIGWFSLKGYFDDQSKGLRVILEPRASIATANTALPYLDTVLASFSHFGVNTFHLYD